MTLTEHLNVQPPRDVRERRTSKGAVAKYMRDVVIPYVGDDCLIWPFGRSSFGYAQFHIQGKCCRAQMGGRDD